MVTSVCLNGGDLEMGEVFWIEMFYYINHIYIYIYLFYIYIYLRYGFRHPVHSVSIHASFC